MAMIGDGNTPYDHANDGKANHIAGCEVRKKKNEEATRIPSD